ncbi:MAG: DUF433 domain-containing protein [Polyangiaceae bacterium]|nr:DUF433 domain-containing protein [Polyangiaceae bacterium]
MYPHVQLDPDVLGGSPVVAGSRVPVRRLWAWHRGGSSVDTLLRRYPQLGAAKILAALAFAYDNEELVEDDLRREREALGADASPPSAGLRPLSQLPLLDEAPPTTPAGRRRR